MDTNIRGYTESQGIISFDFLSDMSSSMSGFQTYSRFTHFFFRCIGKTEEIKLTHNKTICVDIKSFSEWKNLNKENISLLINQDIQNQSIQEIISAILNQLGSYSKTGWGRDRAGNIYRIKQIGSRANETAYRIAERLGGGLDGEVYVLKSNDNSKDKAVKIYKYIEERSCLKTHGLKVHKKRIEKEYDYLKKVPNTEGVELPPKAFFPQIDRDNRGMLIMHKYQGGNIQARLKGMSMQEKNEAADQLINGLTTLHETGIDLRDIKLDNFFVTMKKGKMRYDLCDFGLVNDLEDVVEAKKGRKRLAAAIKEMMLDRADKKQEFFQNQEFFQQPLTEEEMTKLLKDGVSKNILVWVNECLAND